jgi:hypothetical protein
LYLGWGRLRCGKIFNGTLKEFTIKKGMLKKFAINELSIGKIGQQHYGQGPNSWQNAGLNSVEELILVHENILTPRDSMTYVRKFEGEFKLIRMSELFDWKAPVITQASLSDLLKRDKKDAAKKKRSRTMEKTFVSNADKSNSRFSPVA